MQVVAGQHQCKAGTFEVDHEPFNASVHYNRHRIIFCGKSRHIPSELFGDLKTDYAISPLLSVLRGAKGLQKSKRNGDEDQCSR